MKKNNDTYFTSNIASTEFRREKPSSQYFQFDENENFNAPQYARSFKKSTSKHAEASFSPPISMTASQIPHLNSDFPSKKHQQPSQFSQLATFNKKSQHTPFDDSNNSVNTKMQKVSSVFQTNVDYELKSVNELREFCSFYAFIASFFFTAMHFLFLFYFTYKKHHFTESCFQSFLTLTSCSLKYSMM